MCYCQISSIIELIQDLSVIYIVTMFGTNWSTFVDDRGKQSQIQQFLRIQGQITQTVLVRLNS